MLATFLGWLLGFVLVIVLAIAWDVIGGGAQFMIGIGMGAGVGLAQGRVARGWLQAPRQWVGASVIGMGGPFVLGDLLSATGVDFPYSLPIYVATGGLLAGFLQRRLLRPHSDRANGWVPASVVGWTLPVSLVVLNDLDVIPGALGTILFLVAALFGGAVLGAVTGTILIWMLRRPADDAHVGRT